MTNIPVLVPNQLPCLRCDKAIIFSLNKRFSFIPGESGIDVDFHGREVSTLHRGIVGDLCERCAIETAPEEYQAGLLDDLEMLRTIQRTSGLPPITTFQKFSSYPRLDDVKLSEHSMDMFGVWGRPTDIRIPSLRVGMQGEDPAQIYFFLHIVRRSGVHGEIRSSWNPATQSQLHVIDGVEKSTISQLKDLVEGFRLLGEYIEAGDLRRGGRPRLFAYEDARSGYLELWRALEKEYEDGLSATLRPPKYDEICEAIGARIGHRPHRDTLRKLVKQWKHEGLDWPPHDG